MSATSVSSATISATCSHARRRWWRATGTGRLRATASPDGVIAGAIAPLGADVAERLDAFDVTGALERIWEVVRTLNREVETTAPWQLAKDARRADELDRVLYDLVDGLRAVAVALAAYVPADSRGRARGPPPAASVDWSLVAYGLTGETEGIEAAPPLFPRLDAPVASDGSLR